MHQTLLMSWENKTKSLTSRSLHSSKDTLQSGEKRGFIGFMPDRLYYGDIAYQIRASKMFSKIGFFFLSLLVCYDIFYIDTHLTSFIT